MTSDQAISAYLDQVATALPGPSRTRRDLLAELRSGLLDAADAHQCTGLPMAAATQAAISEFGDPGQVAATLRPELTITHARRIALTLLVTGPLIGLLWAVAALGSHFGIRPAPPWQWAGLAPGSRVAAHLAAGSFLLATLTALATIAATGRLTRWLPSAPRIAAATAAMAGFGTAAAELAIFALVASQIHSAPATLDPAPVTAAAAGTLVHLTLTRRSSRRYARAAHS